MRASKPFKKTLLGVSLIHGRFRALSVVDGRTTSNWECPYPVESRDDLSRALQDAVTHTAFPGKRVSFVVEDSRMIHQYHLVPSMKQEDLDRYLGRMVNQDKTFEGPAVWRYRRALRAKERTGLLLDIWPQSFVNDVIGVSQDLSLTPCHLFPFSTVFVDQIRILAVEPQNILLLVTQASDKTVFVVARGDGTPLFDRFLTSIEADDQNPERIGREIIRSVLFTKQQLGQQVSQVWIMSNPESLSADHIQSYVDMPILQSPMAPDPSYWIWVGINLPPSHPSNFIPKEIRTAPIRRSLAKVSAAALAGLVCASVSLSGLVEGLIHHDQKLQRQFLVKTQAFAQEKQIWNGRYQELESKRNWLHAVQAFERPPIVGWFLSYLSQVTPPDIVYTKVAVDRDATGWRVELEGHMPKDFRVSASQLEQLEHALTNSPYRVSIVHGWRESWKRELQMGTKGTDSQHYRPFTLVGRIT